MKKFLLIAVLTISTVFSAFTLDISSIKKAIDGFMADKNANSIKMDLTYGGDSASFYLPSKEIHGIFLAEGKINLLISREIPNDMSEVLSEIPFNAVTAITYSNGLLTITIDASKMLN